MIVEDDIEITVTKYDDMDANDPRRQHRADLLEASIPLDMHVWVDTFMRARGDVHRHAIEKLKHAVAHELYGDLVEPFRKLSHFALESARLNGHYMEIQRCIRQIDAMINLDTINPEHEVPQHGSLTPQERAMWGP